MPCTCRMPALVVAQTLQTMEREDQKLALQQKDMEIAELQHQLAQAKTDITVAKNNALRAANRLNLLVNSVTQTPN